MIKGIIELVILLQYTKLLISVLEHAQETSTTPATLLVSALERGDDVLAQSVHSDHQPTRIVRAAGRVEFQNSTYSSRSLRSGLAAYADAGGTNDQR